MTAPVPAGSSAAPHSPTSRSPIVLTAVAALAVNLPDAHETLVVRRDATWSGAGAGTTARWYRRHRRPRLLVHRGRAVVGRLLPGLSARRASARAGDRRHAARADHRHLGRGPRDAHALRALVRAAPRTTARRCSRSRASRSIRTGGSSTARATPMRCSSRSRSARSSCSKHDQPLLAGLAGAGAAATRPIGVAVAVGLLLRAIERRGGLPGAGSGTVEHARVQARDPGAPRTSACSGDATSACCSRRRG